MDSQLTELLWTLAGVATGYLWARSPLGKRRPPARPYRSPLPPRALAGPTYNRKTDRSRYDDERLERRHESPTVHAGRACPHCGGPTLG